MSLKNKIEEAYKDLKKTFEDCKYIDPDSSNYPEVIQRIQSLEKDLCKFADTFDNYLSNKRVIDAKMVSGEVIDDMYKDIQNNFIERIAKEDKNFIYGYSKHHLRDESKQSPTDARTEYSDNMKKFNSKYKNLNSDFKKSKNLIAFFEAVCKKFNPFGLTGYDQWQTKKWILM